MAALLFQAIQAAAFNGDTEAQRQLESFINDDASAPTICLELLSSQNDASIKHFIATMILAMGRNRKLGEPGQLWNNILSQIQQQDNFATTNLLANALAASAVVLGDKNMNILAQQACQQDQRILLLTSLVEEYNRNDHKFPCDVLLSNQSYYLQLMRVELKASIVNSDDEMTQKIIYCLAQWIALFRIAFRIVDGGGPDSREVNCMLVDSLTQILGQPIRHVKLIESIALLLENVVEVSKGGGIPLEHAQLEQLCLACCHSINFAAEQISLHQQQQLPTTRPFEDLECILLACCRCCIGISVADINYLIYSPMVCQPVIESLILASSMMTNFDQQLSPYLLRTYSLCNEFWTSKLLCHKAISSSLTTSPISGLLSDGGLHVEILKGLLTIRSPGPGDDVNVDRDEWMQFREQNVLELATVCFTKLKSVYLEMLLDSLTQDEPVGQTLAENVLFLTRAAAMEVTRWALLTNTTELALTNIANKTQQSVEFILGDAHKADEVLLRIMTQVLGSTRLPIDLSTSTQSIWQVHPAVIHQSVRLFAMYARWLSQSRRGVGLLNKVMGYSLDALVMNIAEEEDDDDSTSEFASEAIRNLCSRCASLFATPDTLTEMMAALESATNAGLGCRERSTMVQGICRIISTLPPPTASTFVQSLAVPIVTRLLQDAQSGTGQHIKAAVGHIKVLAVIVRTTRAGGPCDQSAQDNAFDRRTAELEAEVIPVVQLLESSWPELSPLLVPTEDAAWCAEVCGLLKVIAVLPLRRNVSLCREATKLVCQFVECAPDAVLEYAKELTEIWGSRAEEDIVHQIPQGFGFVLQQLVLDVVDIIASSFLSQQTHDIDACLLLSTGLELLRNCPLLFAIVNESKPYQKLIDIAMTTCSSNEVTPATLAFQFMMRTLTMKSKVLDEKLNTVSEDKAKFKWSLLQDAYTFIVDRYLSKLIAVLFRAVTFSAPRFFIEILSKSLHQLLGCESVKQQVKDIIIVQESANLQACFCTKLEDNSQLMSSQMTQVVIQCLIQPSTPSPEELETLLEIVWSVSRDLASPQQLLGFLGVVETANRE